MKSNKLFVLVAVILAFAMFACNMETVAPTVAPQATYTPYPTQVPPTLIPTQRPLSTQVPPTAVPAPSSSLSQIFLDNGFVDYGAGDCGTLVCEAYVYNSGNARVNAIVSAAGFGMSAPLGSDYDSGGEGTVMGKVLAMIYQANIMPIAVGQWIVDNMANAANNPSATVQGYTITITVNQNNSGIYFVNVVVGFPGGPTY